MAFRLTFLQSSFQFLRVVDFHFGTRTNLGQRFIDLIVGCLSEAQRTILETHKKLVCSASAAHTLPESLNLQTVGTLRPFAKCDTDLFRGPSEPNERIMDE